MHQRTTLSAAADDLETLRHEARRRGVSLTELLRTLVALQAAEIRARRPPRFGIGRSGYGASAASVDDEDAPASTEPR